jgi:hypothetical protein
MRYVRIAGGRGFFHIPSHLALLCGRNCQALLSAVLSFCLYALPPDDAEALYHTYWKRPRVGEPLASLATRSVSTFSVSSTHPSRSRWPPPSKGLYTCRVLVAS